MKKQKQKTTAWPEHRPLTLTIPKSPLLTTKRRRGNKTVPSEAEECDTKRRRLNENKERSKNPLTLTQTQEFSLSTSRRLPSQQEQLEEEPYMPLGELVANFQNKTPVRYRTR